MTQSVEILIQAAEIPSYSHPGDAGADLRSTEALTLGPVAARDLAAQRSALKEQLDAMVEEWARLSEEDTEGASLAEER